MSFQLCFRQHDWLLQSGKEKGLLHKLKWRGYSLSIAVHIAVGSSNKEQEIQSNGQSSEMQKFASIC